MDQSSWEANTATSQILHFSWNVKVQYCFDKSLSILPVQSQIKPVQPPPHQSYLNLCPFCIFCFFIGFVQVWVSVFHFVTYACIVGHGYLLT